MGGEKEIKKERKKEQKKRKEKGVKQGPQPPIATESDISQIIDSFFVSIWSKDLLVLVILTKG